MVVTHMDFKTKIKKLLNFPNDIFLLMYKSDDKETLDMLNFLIMLNFSLIVYFWFMREPEKLPPTMWECLGLLLAAKFGQSMTSAFKQTGGLTVNRHIYNSATQTSPTVIKTTNSSPTQDKPKSQLTVIDNEGEKRTGKSIHIEGNPEEEV